LPALSNFSATVKLWVTLLAIWLVANASLDREVLLTGVVLATALSLVLAGFSVAYAEVKLSPRVLLHYVLYLLVFVQELVRANLHVARLVFSPRIDIHPGIVEIKTSLKSRTGRMVLANSITLTPGTLVVDIEGDSLFVHWIDVQTDDLEGATQAIAARFEKYLSVIYG
jgi:multicomponent Na+:H+ antiporter subunit E